MSQNKKLLILTQRYQDALSFAVEVHRHQARKGTGIPYVAHVLGVSSLVLAQGGSEDEAVAGLLHDCLEDHPDKVSPADIELRFGSQVLQYVLDCTDTPVDYKGGVKPPWKERKAAHLRQIQAVASRSYRILVADKVDNARATLNDYKILGEKVWQRFNAPRDEQLWYLQSLVLTFRIAGVQSPLMRIFEETVQEIVSLSEKYRGVA